MLTIRSRPDVFNTRYETREWCPRFSVEPTVSTVLLQTQDVIFPQPSLRDDTEKRGAYSNVLATVYGQNSKTGTFALIL